MRGHAAHPPHTPHGPVCCAPFPPVPLSHPLLLAVSALTAPRPTAAGARCWLHCWVPGTPSTLLHGHRPTHTAAPPLSLSLAAVGSGTAAGSTKASQQQRPLPPCPSLSLSHLCLVYLHLLSSCFSPRLLSLPLLRSRSLQLRAAVSSALVKIVAHHPGDGSRRASTEWEILDHVWLL